MFSLWLRLDCWTILYLKENCFDTFVEEVSDEYVNEEITNLYDDEVYEGDKGDTLDVTPPAPNCNREGDADVDVELLQWRPGSYATLELTSTS